MSGESDVQEALRKIFDADTGIYAQRGFQRRVGFGTRPALVHIDLANAWTRPGNAFTCDGMDTIIPAVQKLNEAGRAKGIPIVYTTTAYTTTGSNSDMGLWVRKIPVEVLQAGTEAVADRQPHRAEAGRARDRQEARERLPRHRPLELSQRPRRRHRDPHGRDDVRLRAALLRGRDRRGLPAHRRARSRRRPRARRRWSGTSSTSTRSSATSSRSSACSATSTASRRSRAGPDARALSARPRPRSMRSAAPTPLLSRAETAPSTASSSPSLSTAPASERNLALISAGREAVLRIALREVGLHAQRAPVDRLDLDLGGPERREARVEVGPHLGHDLRRDGAHGGRRQRRLGVLVERRLAHARCRVRSHTAARTARRRRSAGASLRSTGSTTIGMAWLTTPTRTRAMSSGPRSCSLASAIARSIGPWL